MKKKLLSGIMALAMVMSLLPVTALAADTGVTCNGGDKCTTHEAAVTVDGTTLHYTKIYEALHAAGGESGAGGTVTLLKNAELKGQDTSKDDYGAYGRTTFIYKNIILDLGRNTLTCNDQNGLVVRPGVNFTIKNGSYENTASSYGTGIEASKSKSGNDYTGCTVTIDNATVQAAFSGVYATGYTTINVKNGGKIIATDNTAISAIGPHNTVNVENSKIEGKTYGIFQQVYDKNLSNDLPASTFNIEDSAIKGGLAAINIASNEGIAQSNHTLTVTNSEITGANGIILEGTNAAISGADTNITAGDKGFALIVRKQNNEQTVGAVEVTGGTFKGLVYIYGGGTATINITGGTFNKPVQEDYIQPGMTQDPDTGKIKLDPDTAVAKIGDVGYSTLSAAIAAANGDTGTDPMTITITKSGDYALSAITRDYVTIEADTGVTATFTVSSTAEKQLNAANITLKNLNFVSENGATIISSGACDSLKLEKCTFTGDSTGTAVYVHQPNVTITGCTFKDFERGYYTCGDNNPAGTMSFTENKFINVRVPIDGYWGMKATDDTSITITGNTFDAGDWDAAYIQLWDYAQYLNWLNGNVEDSREGSAIKNAVIENNTYIGDVVIYATHFNWYYNSDLELDEASKQLLKYRVLVELENAASATVTNADGSEITAFNESTASRTENGKTFIYSLSEGKYSFSIKPTSSTEGLVSDKYDIKQPTVNPDGSTTNKISVANEEVTVATVNGIEYSSLAEAITAANGTEYSVDLCADISIDTWNQIWNIDGLTINGNNHTVTIGEVESNVNGDYLTYDAENLNVSNLTIKLETNGNGFDMVSGKLENVRLYGGSGSNYGVFVSTSDATDNAKVEIEKCLFDGFDMAIYSQPAGDTSKRTSDITVNNTTFNNCGKTMCSYAQNTVFTNNSVTGGDEISFAAGGEGGAARENTYTVTGNTFQNAGEIWFYEADLAKVEFEKNQVLGTTKVSTENAKRDSTLDVSKNYWGGKAPTSDQVSDSNVTGNDVYYERNTMYPSDLNTYNPPSSGGGGVTTYSVTLPTDVANGKLSVSPKNAAKGSTVTLTVTPDEGYQLATLTVTDKNGKTVELTKKSDTQYTFKMPASNVSIKATFAPVETPPATLPFTDVDGHWALDAITYVYEKGMMNGTSPTTFSPESQLTRGMIVTILYRLEDEPAVSDSTFSDVDGDMYYADPIAWAADNGIVTGFPDGTFGPETSITREQLATILYRYADYLDCDMTPAADLSGYTDAGTISSYAQQAMAWANAEGLITGVTETTLKPTGTATRAQVATILMRFCENVIK